MTNGPYTNPTYQGAVDNGLEDICTFLKNDIMRKFNSVKIGVIKSFSAADQTASVQIAQSQVTSVSPTGVETLAPYPLLQKVPVFFPQGGGFALTFPVAAGDECILLFNDRDMDSWFSAGAGLPPNTYRFHDLSDGLALVGIRNSTRSMGSVSTGTAQLRSNDGLTYVEVAGGGIVNVVAPTQINLNSPIVNIQGVINVQNVNSAAIPCNITGALQTTGDIKSNSGAHSLNNHVHSGITSGSSNSGGPVG